MGIEEIPFIGAIYNAVFNPSKSQVKKTEEYNPKLIKRDTDEDSLAEYVNQASGNEFTLNELRSLKGSDNVYFKNSGSDPNLTFQQVINECYKAKGFTSTEVNNEELVKNIIEANKDFLKSELKDTTDYKNLLNKKITDVFEGTGELNEMEIVFPTTVLKNLNNTSPSKSFIGMYDILPENQTTVSSNVKSESDVGNLYGAYYNTASSEKNITPKNDTAKVSQGTTIADLVKSNYGISEDNVLFDAYCGQILEANRNNLNWAGKSDAVISSNFYSSKAVTGLIVPDDTMVTVNGDSMKLIDLKTNISNYEAANGVLNNLNITFNIEDATDLDLQQFADKNGKITIDGTEYDVNEADKNALFNYNSIMLDGTEYKIENEIDYSKLKGADISKFFNSEDVELPVISSEGNNSDNSLLEITDTKEYIPTIESVTISEGQTLNDVIMQAYGFTEDDIGTIGFNYALNQVIQYEGNDKLFNSTGTERINEASEKIKAGVTVQIPEKTLVLDVYDNKNKYGSLSTAKSKVEDDDKTYFQILKGNQNISGNNLNSLNDKIQANLSTMVDYGVVKNELLKTGNTGAAALIDEYYKDTGETATNETFESWTREKVGDSNNNETTTMVNQILAAWKTAADEAKTNTVWDYVLNHYFVPNSKNTLSRKANDGTYQNGYLTGEVKQAIINANPSIFNSDGTLISTGKNITDIILPDVLYNLNETPETTSTNGGGGGDTPDPGCDPIEINPGPENG